MSVELCSRPVPDPRPSAVHLRPDSRPHADWEPLPLVIERERVETRGDEAVPAAVRSFATGLIRCVLEVLESRRPPVQLTRWMSARVLGDLAPRIRRGRRGEAPLVLRSVRLQRRAAGSVEVAARVSRGDVSSALALRLEEVGSHWVCVELDFGPTPPGHPQRL